MLIRRAEINFTQLADVRVEAGSVSAIAEYLEPRADEVVIDAKSCALIPGLHDHHLHFFASAAALESVFCGPPHIHTEADLIVALQAKAETLGTEQRWLRGIGYHEAVAGAIDRDWLDRVLPSIPTRIQQRSGRLWTLNSCALDRLGNLSDSPLEKIDGKYTGRLYDADIWLREKIGSQLPDVKAASAQLAKYGVTGFTDASVSNSKNTFAQFAELQKSGDLLQRVVMMGDESLQACGSESRLQSGALKIHLHEHDLPDFAAMCVRVAAAHAAARPVAVHCVTLAELVFTLNVFAEVGSIAGDRIEHAAIAPPEIVEQIKQLRLIVVTQPNFIAERGDIYRREVEIVDQPWLYRLRGFAEAGVPLVAGTDAPFGNLNPWLAMQAAVTRSTVEGAVIGCDEALTPEGALELFLGDPLQPGRGKNRIEVGMTADLCWLDRSWRDARENLLKVGVNAVLINGGFI